MLQAHENQSALARRRRAVGLGQTPFAALVQITPPIYGLIERGRRRMEPSEAQRIDEALAILETAVSAASAHVQKLLAS